MKWYNTWFGTSYYDLLYNNRDDEEAQHFIDNIITFLKPSADANFLDYACGKGRHALYLNSLGFDVTGIDLSEASILHCLQFENKHLHFYVHDMRRMFRVNDFDFVLNLFTSFGYFEKTHHNQLAIDAAAKALKKHGVLVIDFFNSRKVTDNLIAFEKRQIGNITFEISKKVEEGIIEKEIKVIEDNNEKYFYESVQALLLSDFEKYLSLAGMKIKNVFGDYSLSKFDSENSDRLIIIAERVG